MDTYDSQERQDSLKDGQTQEEIAEKYATIKRNQYLLLIPFVIVMILLFSGSDNSDFNFLGMSSTILDPLAVFAVIGMIIFSFYNWRCPVCRGYLGKGGGKKFCPRCGAKFTLDEE